MTDWLNIVARAVHS